MKLIAIDFETANSSFMSACALGISIYEDGMIEDNFQWLIKPHSRFNYFTNTSIHHISKEDVASASSFLDYYETLYKLLNNQIIIAHNASFDISVLNQVCDLYGLDHIPFHYFDTVAFARRVYKGLPNYRLNTLASYLNVELDHHNAKSDAMSCLMIVLKAMENFDTYDLDRLLKMTGTTLKINM